MNDMSRNCNRCSDIKLRDFIIVEWLGGYSLLDKYSTYLDLAIQNYSTSDALKGFYGLGLNNRPLYIVNVTLIIF